MFRRLSAVGCALALVVALLVAALHNHEVQSASHAGDSAGCMYCVGGMAPAVAAKVAPAAERMWAVAEPLLVEAPSLRRLQPLAHSGNAPPA